LTINKLERMNLSEKEKKSELKKKKKSLKEIA
jgi:hypothetical protein